MPELQAIIDFSIQINKFINIDLFQRGFYQIRLSLKLPNCKLPNKIELQQQSRPPPSNSPGGKSAFTLINHSANAHADDDDDDDLDDGAGGQIRFQQNQRPSPSRFRSNYGGGGSNIILPQCIVNGMAVSKTFQITYKNEEIILNDLVSFRMNICLDVINCIKQIQSTEIVLEVELWYSGQDVVLNQFETIYCVSNRKLKIHLDLCRGVHYCLPVIFDYFHLSAVTMTIHGCLLTICQPYICCNKNDGGSSATTPPWLYGFIKSDGGKPEKKTSATHHNGWLSEAERKQQNSLILQQWRLQLTHWKLVSILALSLFNLKRTIDEYYRLLPPWQQAKIHYETLFINGSVDNLSELSRKCLMEIENNHLYEDDSNDYSLNDLSTMIGMDNPEDGDNLLGHIRNEPDGLSEKKIEDRINTIEHDIGRLCGLIIEQWQRFLVLSVDPSDRINQHLAKRHHFQRIRRFAEAFFCIEQPRGNLNSVCDQNSNAFLELSEQLRKSAYFINLPPCDVECIHIDGDSTTLPIIFEEKYEHPADAQQENENLGKNGPTTILNCSPSKQSLSTSSSTSSSANSPKQSNLRTFFARLNNTYDRSVGRKGDWRSSPQAQAPQSNNPACSGNEQMNTLELFDLYRTELFKTNAATGGNLAASEIDLINRKIQLLHSLLARRNLIKNYSQLSLEYSNEKIKRSINRLHPQMLLSCGAASMDDNRESSLSWPNLSPDILTLDLGDPPNGRVGVSSSSSSFRRITGFRRKTANHNDDGKKNNKTKKSDNNKHHHQHHQQEQQKQQAAVSSLHVFPVVNYQNFSGTMYFPKPPKQFAMQEVDEPSQEICSKPIPITNDHGDDNGDEPSTTTRTRIQVEGIDFKELSLNDDDDNDTKKKNDHHHHDHHHHSHGRSSSRISNSHSFQDLIETIKSEDGKPAPPPSTTKKKIATTKDDIGLKSSQPDILNNGEFTFMELLRSDHCLICCRAIQQPSPANDSWPCKCTKKLKPKHVESKSTKPLDLAPSPATTTTDSAVAPQSPSQFKRVSSFDTEFIQFLHEKESFRNSAAVVDKFKNLMFYSDRRTLASRVPYFQCESDLKTFTDLHLIVCVHGLDGNSADLRLVKTYLEIGLPTNNFEFLMSQRNQGETFDDLETLTTRLINEIDQHCTTFKLTPAKLSFIGHSLGSIIIRAATSRPDFQQRWQGRLHTFLSLSGPHLGLAYNRSGLVNLGLWFIQKFRKAPSLNQLSMKDAQDVRQTFLYRLSNKPCLEHFRNVLLCGSSQDRYVPIHSAHVELCTAAINDASDYGVAYREMAENILKRLLAKTEVNIVRYDVHHALNSNTNTMIGRAAHIAVLDSELFIEKFMMVVGLKYFA